MLERRGNIKGFVELELLKNERPTQKLGRRGNQNYKSSFSQGANWSPSKVVLKQYNTKAPVQNRKAQI